MLPEPASPQSATAHGERDVQLWRNSTTSPSRIDRSQLPRHDDSGVLRFPGTCPVSPLPRGGRMQADSDLCRWVSALCSLSRREVLERAASTHQLVKHAVECAQSDRKMTLSSSRCTEALRRAVPLQVTFGQRGGCGILTRERTGNANSPRIVSTQIPSGSAGVRYNDAHIGRHDRSLPPVKR